MCMKVKTNHIHIENLVYWLEVQVLIEVQPEQIWISSMKIGKVDTLDLCNEFNTQSARAFEKGWASHKIL